MRMRWLAAVLFAFTCSGCLLSLQPIYTDRDVVFDPALVGRWYEGSERANTWTFEKAGDNAYTLTVVEDGKRDRFSAHLTRLGGTLFLDLMPKERDIDAASHADRFIDDHLIPAHSVWRLALSGDSLKLRGVGETWLKEELESGRATLAYSTIDWNQGRAPIITASTADLQKFIARFANDDKAFSKDAEGDFHRVR